MNIVDLLKQDEGKTFERKQDDSSPKNIVKSLVAFANTAGGTIVIGVDDGTKHIRGVGDNPHAMEERLASLVYDNIEPKLIPEIEVVSYRNHYLLKLTVYPSLNRPHYYKKRGPDKGTYVRVGSTNRVADSVMIQELRRLQKLQTFDEETMLEVGEEQIDFQAMSEAFKQTRKLKKADLLSLGIVVKQGKKLFPTVGGVILFGKNRLQNFPDAYIEAGRFQGSDKSKPLDTLTINTYPVIAVDEAMAFVKKHAMQGITIPGQEAGGGYGYGGWDGSGYGEGSGGDKLASLTKHRKSWSVPLTAIRETVINAVVHADYAQIGTCIRIAIFDDRIEIENPGLLLFGLTIEDLYQGVSKLRNRVIARVFHRLGLIEQWGSGIRRVITECEKTGLPQPVFEELATHFRVTIFIQQKRPATLDQVERNIMAYLMEVKGGGASTSEVAAAIALSTRATRTRLVGLIAAGLVVEWASSKNDPHRRYYAKYDVDL